MENGIGSLNKVNIVKVVWEGDGYHLKVKLILRMGYEIPIE